MSAAKGLKTASKIIKLGDLKGTSVRGKYS
jgi:hypothetical protein